MWCYRIMKPLLPGETRAQTMARAAQAPGVVAVEPFADCPEVEGLAGVAFVEAFQPAPGEARLPDVPNALRDDLARLFLEHPEALPGTVCLVWLDAGGAIAAHLADEAVAVHNATRHARHGSRNPIEEALQKAFNDASARSRGAS